MPDLISPLFAVQAKHLFDSGNQSEALELCLLGIETYTHYSTAYALTARLMWELQDSNQAKEFLTTALEIFPTHKALLSLHQEFFKTKDRIPERNSGTDTSVENENAEIKNENIQVEDKNLRMNEAEVQKFNVDTHIEIGEVIYNHEDQQIDYIHYDTNDLYNLPTNPTIQSEASTQIVHDTGSRVQLSTDQKTQGRYSPLRIIETIKVPHVYMSSIKAAEMKIIPGLYFTPLRFQTGKVLPKYGELPPPPKFPQFNKAINPKRLSTIQISSTIESTIEQPLNVQIQKLTPLEELALRLEKIRLPAIHEEIARSPSTELLPAMVTETMARIYEKQGAYPEAIKAYQILARRTPEKMEFYEEKIREAQLLMKNEAE